MSHLSCIGFEVDAEGFEPLLDRVLDATPAPATGRSRHFTEASGATLLFACKGRTVECVTPFFAAAEPTVWQVRSSAPTLDGDCRHCSGVDVDVLDVNGEMVTRTCVQLAEFEPYRAWLSGERRWSLELAGFAQVIALYPDEAAFAAEAALGDEPGSHKLAANAFMPFGMFGDGADVGARATVLLAGRVVAAERRANGFVGQDFVQLVVDTFPGRLNVVAPLAAVSALPEPGHIAKVQAWVVGRPTEAPPPAARKKLFGVF